MDFLKNLNYVTKVEILVIAAVVAMAVYVAYSLDLLKKEK